MSNWMGDYLNKDKKLEVEAFSDLPKQYVIVDRLESAVITRRAYGSDTKNFALRLDKTLSDRVDKAFIGGSKNSALNALIALGLDYLDENDKTLLAE